MRTLFRWLIRIALVLVVIAIGLGIAAAVASDPRPRGTPGEAAETLARRIEQAVDLQAWNTTGAIRWNFFGAHDFLWDKQRGIVEVRWDDNRVLLRTADRTGAAFVNEQRVSGTEAADLIESAYAFFANDSFWLNPLVKLRDPGVELGHVQLDDGTEGLLVTYTSGGVTPGDAYLWLINDDGLPREWRMWVKIIPIGGMRTTWTGWQTLSTGAIISTKHGVLGKELEFIRGAQAAATLTELVPGADPFAVLTAPQL